MNGYLINELPICFPDDINEMKNIFSKMLEQQKKEKISFINPEIFMQQDKNEIMHEYFKSCKYNFIDGIGLLYAINGSCGTKYSNSNRYPGTDFFEYLPNRKIKVFLYGSKKENVEIAKTNIEKKYTNIEIVDFFDGYTKIEEECLVSRINKAAVDILIVCIGCPKQELWIQKNIEKIECKIVFGNGGAVDFWSGAVKRAPDFMIRHGLEFLFRLFQNFTLARIKRQSKLFKFFALYKFKKYRIEKYDFKEQ